MKTELCHDLNEIMIFLKGVEFKFAGGSYVGTPEEGKGSPWVDNPLCQCIILCFTNRLADWRSKSVPHYIHPFRTPKRMVFKFTYESHLLHQRLVTCVFGAHRTVFPSSEKHKIDALYSTIASEGHCKYNELERHKVGFMNPFGTLAQGLQKSMVRTRSLCQKQIVRPVKNNN